jgi:hypothetical protein
MANTDIICYIEMRQMSQQVGVDCGYVNEDDTEDISIQPPPSDVTQMSGAQTMSLQSKGVNHILQRHGDVINVNVGWAHQVINLQPCVKYAFDYASAHEATQCIHTNNVFHTRFKNVHPTDYRGMEREGTLAGRHM